MAKSHKAHKRKKSRAKTTLPPVKETRKNHADEKQRSLSISPSVQQKAQRGRTLPRKEASDRGERHPVSKSTINVTTSTYSVPPQSTTLVDAFSNLKINDKKNNASNPPRRNYSKDAGNKKTGKVSSNGSNRKYSSLQDIVKLIETGRAKNIVVMAGAGISTGSGIPDFRTPGTGLYDNLKQYRIPSPTAIFDLDYFHFNPKPFFTLAKELYPSGKYRPCLPHYFVRLLHDKGLLLRMYTQNIDGLERIAGIPPEKLVEAHGTFSTASCTRCGKKYNGKDIKKKILRGAIPRCESSELCWGVVKPDIVFFGEDLPRRFYYYLKDFPSCDLLIIMGTSLEVEPFASLTDSVRSTTPRLLLNRELVGPFAGKSRKRNHDVAVTGDLADSINRFAVAADWSDELKSLLDNDNFPEDLGEKDSIQDTASSDSGLSSPSTDSSSSKSKRSLLPPDNNIKRYFHTLRSTPLPNPSRTPSGHTRPVQNASYYDYIKNKDYVNPCASELDQGIAQRIQRSVTQGDWKKNSIKIQYAQTVHQKKGKIPSFGSGKKMLFSPDKSGSSSASGSSSDSQSESSDPESCYNTSSSGETSG